MDPYEETLKAFMRDSTIEGEHLTFNQSCHSVEEAARAVNASPDDFVKSMCMVDQDKNLIVAIVLGEHRASTSRVARALKIERPRIAAPEEVLEKTGYPVGGVPPFGFEATFLIDPKVMEKELIYGGGGSETSLTKISPKELQKANNGQIARVRK
jgi:Cys-tRNA(Pro)/Cys-tRNA(Cys) deacylase